MKILDIALKDLLRNFRSAMAVGMMFIAPLLITGLIYMAFGGGGGGAVDLPVTRVVLVNHDAPPQGYPNLGGSLGEMLSDPSVAQWLQISSADTDEAALAQVNRQQAGVAVILPADFSKSVFSGSGRPEVRLVQDPTLTIGPLVVRNMIGSLIDGAAGAHIAIQAELNRRTALGLPVSSAPPAYLQAYQDWFTTFQRTLYHSPQAALVSQAPAQGGGSGAAGQTDMQRILALVLVGMIVFFSFYTGANAMMSLLKEDEEGTLARLFTTPTDRTAILTGKFLAVLLMVIVQGLVLLALGALLFGVRWGDPLRTGIALVGQVLAATSLGVFVISLAKNMRQAGAMVGGVLTALGMLGGLFTVAVSMPAGFETVSLFTPHGWVMRAWKASLTGAPLTELWLALAVLVVMSLVLFGAGASAFRRRFA